MKRQKEITERRKQRLQTQKAKEIVVRSRKRSTEDTERNPSSKRRRMTLSPELKNKVTLKIAMEIQSRHLRPTINARRDRKQRAIIVRPENEEEVKIPQFTRSGCSVRLPTRFRE